MSGTKKLYFLLAGLILFGFAMLYPRIYTKKTTRRSPIDNSPNTGTEKLLSRILNLLENRPAEIMECNPNATTPQLYDKNFICINNCTCTKRVYKNCQDAVAQNKHKNDVFPLDLNIRNLPSFYAFCEQENQYDRAWMIIQRRKDGSQNFNRNWTDYKNGFGDLYSEYWIGLERLHLITLDAYYELWIELETFNETSIALKYTRFSIASEREHYMLSLGGFIGDTWNALKHNNGKPFSTFDNKNHEAWHSCPLERGGGWWFTSCLFINLNGPYFQESNRYTYQGVFWYGFPYPWESLKYAHMAIRPAVE